MNKDFNTKREVLINDEPKTWKKEGKYKGWIIQIKKSEKGYELNVRGSLHKFFHGDNAGKFSGLEVIAAIQGMCDLFEIEPEKAFVLNIEVGINLLVWFAVLQYLEENLLYHKKKQKEEFDKIGFRFRHDDYRIKLYQKEKYKLRFEVKYTAKAKLDLFAISTIADLNQTSIVKLAESLIPEFGEVIMRDGINVYDEKLNPNNLTKKERHNLLRFSSDIYQQGYKEELTKARNSKNRNRSDALRVKANRLKRFCMEIILKKGDQSHRKIMKLIEAGIEDFKLSW